MKDFFSSELKNHFYLLKIFIPYKNFLARWQDTDELETNPVALLYSKDK